MDDSPSPAPGRGLGEPPPEHRQPRDRRPFIIGAGALTAVALGAAVAFGLFRSDPADDTPPPAAEGGLKVELGDVQGGDRIDPARPLRCFVEGRFVGELTVVQCAQRNGVAAQNLDVGLDDNGALAAVVSVPGLSAEPQGSSTELPADAIPVDVPEPAPVSAPQAGPAGECLRHVGGEWRSLGEELGLSTCLDVLYAGRCEPPGSASYGRWNGQTLRLVTGRIEIAPDGANFRTLAEQDPQSCMLP